MWAPCRLSIINCLFFGPLHIQSPLPSGLCPGENKRRIRGSPSKGVGLVSAVIGTKSYILIYYQSISLQVVYIKGRDPDFYYCFLKLSLIDLFYSADNNPTIPIRSYC